MLKIVAATKNKHKVEEFKNLLDHPDVEILSGADIDLPEVDEDASTFKENAEKKAISASEFTGMPAFADDSGLMVEALGGKPGVASARYAGEHGNDQANMEKLLREMENIENRRAKFVCVIAVANEGEVIETFTGEVCGTITREKRGTNGFGYDPIFMPDGYDKTFGELDSEIKNKISHRAKAIKKAVEFFEDAMDIPI